MIRSDTIPLIVMKLIFYIQIVGFIILMAQSCVEKEDCHRAITIVNNSNGEIWLGESGAQHGLSCRQVPGLIPSGTSYELDLLRVCWEDRINRTYRGKVVFYFFQENYFSAHSECDSIQFNQSVKERREYTVGDLNRLKWVIAYP
jgi:hypothetical protein